MCEMSVPKLKRFISETKIRKVKCRHDIVYFRHKHSNYRKHWLKSTFKETECHKIFAGIECSFGVTLLTVFVFDRLLNLAEYELETVYWKGTKAKELGHTDIHPYWYKYKPLAVHVEVTAYALLAFVERERARNPRKIMLDYQKEKMTFFNIYLGFI